MKRLACLMAMICAAFSAHAQEAHVHIDSGDLVGVTRDRVESFKGIPYAAPPVGTLRWRPPQAAQHWNKSLSAVDYGASCPQEMPVRRVPAGSAAERTSEDCLTLNVWTPVEHSHPLPVMVWIHGGGNNNGTGSQTFYDGTAFARDGLVLVTLNYRLGMPGFFTHPALTREAGKALNGNYGLQDQMAALQWVQRNAAAFGGDAKNVTVFGESAGGEDILLLMTSPSAGKLFSKAIVESAGGWNGVRSLSDSEKQSAAFASALGLQGDHATAAELRAVPVDSLSKVPDQEALGPVVDGRLLPRAPVEVFAQGRALDIPLIIGTNGNEGSVLPEELKPGFALDGLSADAIDTARKLYGASTTDDNAFAHSLFRDGFFATPARWAAARESEGAPSYLYHFTYVMSRLRARRAGANHGSEIPFVFDTASTDRLSDADRAVTNAVHSCWVAFAKTATPVCTGAPAWPAYHRAEDSLLEFGDTIAVRTTPDRAVLDFLEQQLLPAATIDRAR